jgi:hypothetical protein
MKVNTTSIYREDGSYVLVKGAGFLARVSGTGELPHFKKYEVCYIVSTCWFYRMLLVCQVFSVKVFRLIG